MTRVVVALALLAAAAILALLWLLRRSLPWDDERLAWVEPEPDEVIAW